jgi:hypothetical protein
VTEVEADPNLLFARADPAIGYQLCSAPIVNLYAYSNSNCTTARQRRAAQLADLLRPEIRPVQTLATENFHERLQGHSSLDRQRRTRPVSCFQRRRGADGSLQVAGVPAKGLPGGSGQEL